MRCWSIWRATSAFAGSFCPSGSPRYGWPRGRALISSGPTSPAWVDVYKRQAQESAKTHPFSDVPDWADGYVSYAYTAGLTKGVSEDRFGAADTASAEMYLTFMLRALGYTEGDSGDFSWDAHWTLAEECGILPSGWTGRAFCGPTWWMSPAPPCLQISRERRSRSRKS